MTVSPMVLAVLAEEEAWRIHAQSTWQCQKCGACCEVLPSLLFGQPCENYDKENRLCKIYEDRPEMCHAHHFFGEKITEMYCEKLREIRTNT